MNVKHVIDDSVDSADQYNTVYAHIIGSGFRGLVLFAGYDNYAASGNTPVTQYRFSKDKGFEYRSGIALGGHKYSWDKAWNEDWNAVGNGSGVRVITPEESAGWDDEIPLTFSGDLYDIAGWNDKLWVLNQIAATPGGGTNYFWEFLLTVQDLDDALLAKEDAANKVTAINQSNKNSTTLFPTVGASVLYMTELTGSISPQMFGAKANGIDDDTSAIQAALDAGALEKKAVFLSGEYKITAPLSVPENAAIVGSGKHGAAINSYSSSVFANLSYVKVANVYFTNYSSETASFVSGAVTQLTMRGCSVKNYDSIFEGGIKSLSRIESNSFTGIRGFFTTSVVDSSISKNYINASRTTFGTSVAFRAGLYNTVVDGNYVDFWTAVFVTKDGAVSSISNNVFDNCYTVFFQRASMLTITGNTFSNIHYVEKNWKSGSTYYVPTGYRENWAVFRFNKTNDPLTAALIPLDDGEAETKRRSSLNRLTFTANSLAGVANGSALVDFLISIQDGNMIQAPVFSVVIASNEINPDTECDFRCAHSSLDVNLKGMFIQPLERAVYDTLPNASLTKDPVQTYDGHQIIYQNRLMTNINGTWYTSALESDIPAVPTKVSELTNDAGYLTQHQDISGKVDKVEGKGLSTNDYTTAEKNKLGGIESGATKTVVDSALSSTSTNPVQNKVIQKALNDLPAVPTKVSELTNDSGYLTLGTLPVYNGGVQ